MAVCSGWFEHLYETNFAGVPDIATHYIVLAYRIDVEVRPTPPYVQHSKYTWLSGFDARADGFRSSIHPNTVAYFDYL